MIKLFQMHLGLIKYLYSELKKKRALRGNVLFLYGIGKRYLQTMLVEYKNSFLIVDADYQKQKKQYDNYNTLKKDLNRAVKMLHYIDEKLIKNGWTRQRRRAFWRDFYSNGQVRTEVFNDLVKEIGE